MNDKMTVQDRVLDQETVRKEIDLKFLANGNAQFHAQNGVLVEVKPLNAWRWTMTSQMIHDNFPKPEPPIKPQDILGEMVEKPDPTDEEFVAEFKTWQDAVSLRVYTYKVENCLVIDTDSAQETIMETRRQLAAYTGREGQDVVEATRSLTDLSAFMMGSEIDTNDWTAIAVIYAIDKISFSDEEGIRQAGED